MKNQMLSVRLSVDERKRLDDLSHTAGMTPSAYLRSLIRANSSFGVCSPNHAAAFCHLRIALAEQGFTENEMISEEMNRLCQTLSRSAISIQTQQLCTAFLTMCAVPE